MSDKRTPRPPTINTPGPRRPDDFTPREFAAIVAREQARQRRSLSRLTATARWRRWS